MKKISSAPKEKCICIINPEKQRAVGVVHHYSVATCYFENGKNKKKILFGIGELNDQQADMYRLLLKGANGDYNCDNIVELQKIIFENDKQYLAPLAISALWRKFGLHKIFSNDVDHNQKISTQIVAQILTINRLLKPAAKSKTVEWFNKTHLDKILGIEAESYDKNKIFRELPQIHKAKPLLERLFFDFSQKNQSKLGAYYFDGSTSWFEGECCPLAEADLEKTRGFFPKVLGLMLITDSEGFPVAWEIVNGHQRDNNEIKDFVMRIADQFGIKKITYCFDRGVASESNFDLIAEKDSRYISAIRDNQIKDVFDLNRFEKTRSQILQKISANISEKIPEKRRIVDTDHFVTSDNNIFFRDLEVIGGKRYVCSFNYDLYVKNQKTREYQIEQTLLSISEKNAELSTAKRDRDFNVTERELLKIFAHFNTQTFFKYELQPKISSNNAQSFKIECVFKKEQERLSQLTDGILVFISNLTEKIDSKYSVSASEIIAHYKGKYVVENAFRELKSFLDFRPIHVWTEEHVKAHYDICIIAYFINNYIYRELEEQDCSLRSFHEEIEDQGKIAKLKIPSGKSIYTLKKVSEKLKKTIEQLNLKEILSTKLHTSHGVF